MNRSLMGLDRLPIKAGALFLLLFWPAPALSAYRAEQFDKKAVITQARQAYYSLRRLGLVEFQSNMKPNWEVVLGAATRDPSGMALLNGLHFALTLDENGSVKVTHQSESAVPDEKVEAVNQIYGGMEEAVSGFFATWNLFMLTSPFPSADSEYGLQDTGGQFLLTYKDGSADVSTTMTKDILITEIKVVTPEFTSSVRPRLVRNQKGLVLSGYTADYVPTKGPGKVKLNVQIDYQEVKGLQLPRKLHVNSTYDDAPNQMELWFSDYQVRTR